jgi:Uncharacterized protein conserved in bacteria
LKLGTTQGIEFCIDNALLTFDPGVQGEQQNKKEGFCPIEMVLLHIGIKKLQFKKTIN